MGTDIKGIPSGGTTPPSSASSSFHPSSYIHSIPSSILTAFEVTEEEVLHALSQEEEYIRQLVGKKVKSNATKSINHSILNEHFLSGQGLHISPPKRVGRSLKVLDEPYRKLVREETGFPAFLGLVLFQRICEVSCIFDGYVSLLLSGSCVQAYDETAETPSLAANNDGGLSGKFSSPLPSSRIRLPSEINESLFLSRIEFQRQLSRKRCMDDNHSTITILDWLRFWPFELSLSYGSSKNSCSNTKDNASLSSSTNPSSVQYLRALRLSLLTIPSPSPFIIHTVLDLRQKFFTSLSPSLDTDTASLSSTSTELHMTRYYTLLGSVLRYQYQCTGNFQEFYPYTLPYMALRQRWFYHDPLTLFLSGNHHLSMTNIMVKRNLTQLMIDIHHRVRSDDLYPIIEALVERHPDLASINSSIQTRQRYIDFVTSALMMMGYGTCTTDVSVANLFALTSSRVTNHVVEGIYLTAVSYLSEVPLFNPLLFKHFDGLFSQAVHDTRIHRRTSHRRRSSISIDTNHHSHGSTNGSHHRSRSSSSSHSRHHSRTNNNHHRLSSSSSTTVPLDYTTGSYLTSLSIHSKLNHIDRLINPSYNTSVSLPQPIALPLPNEILVVNKSLEDTTPTKVSVPSPNNNNNRQRSISLTRGLTKAADRLFSVLRVHDSSSVTAPVPLFRTIDNNTGLPGVGKGSLTNSSESELEQKQYSSSSDPSSRTNSSSPVFRHPTIPSSSVTTHNSLSLTVKTNDSKTNVSVTLPLSLLSLFPVSFTTTMTENFYNWYQHSSPAVRSIFTLPSFVYPPSLLPGTLKPLTVSGTKEEINNYIVSNRSLCTTIYENENKEWDTYKHHIFNNQVHLSSVHRYMELHISKVVLERVFHGYGRSLHPDSKYWLETVRSMDNHDTSIHSNYSLEVAEPTLAYKDMVYLYHAVNDRFSTSRSIPYWYYILDMDGDNSLSVNDLQSIYEGKAWELRQFYHYQKYGNDYSGGGNDDDANDNSDNTNPSSSGSNKHKKKISPRILSKNYLMTTMVGSSSNHNDTVTYTSSSSSSLPALSSELKAPVSAWGDDILTTTEIVSRIVQLLPPTERRIVVPSSKPHREIPNHVHSTMTSSSSCSTVYGSMTIRDIQRDKIGRILFDLLIAIPCFVHAS